MAKPPKWMQKLNSKTPNWMRKFKWSPWNRRRNADRRKKKAETTFLKSARGWDVGPGTEMYTHIDPFTGEKTLKPERRLRKRRKEDREKPRD